MYKNRVKVNLISIFDRRLAPFVMLEQLRDVSLKEWTTPGHGGSMR